MRGFVFLTLAFMALAEDPGQGIQLYQSGNYDQAEKVLATAVAQDPNNARAQLYYGLTLLVRKKPKEAEQAFRKAGSLTPNNAKVKAGLAGAMIDQQRLDDASAFLQQAAAIDSSDADYIFQRGRLSLARRKYQDAANDLDQVSSLEPKNAYAYYYDGLAYNGLGKLDQALQKFQMFLQLAPNAPEATRVRALMGNVQ
jgi:tetratricopeptide (TPR) repeat protein